MLPRKAQPRQGSETLQKLQRLVQLSDMPLVRFSTTTLSRHQFWIMSSLFVVMLIFAILKPAPWLTVKPVAAIEFFSAVSQSLAALLGVLIVFLTVTNQLIYQRQLDDYRILQTQIERLIQLTQTLPSELSRFDGILVEVIRYLVPLQMKDFPVYLSTDVQQAVFMEKLLENFEQEWTEKQQQFSLAARLHLQQTLLLLNNMKEILEEFVILYDRILELGRFILAIVRLSFLLGVSLLSLLLFGIIELQNNFPDLSIPITVTLAAWVLIAVLELVGDAWYVYKSFYGALPNRSIHH
ncbi:MAG: hypothetical protein KME43_14940 [Myxacorys chilensis ATA2-1-KO14]|jgi:hypothetical protein|nr:hypothetical protein [Myxacorys chilensis ATA2-1-KO14]